jgi:YebC/PmpR family DNA-binding regulatory protein
MAGHSKWKNIRLRKGKQDALRGKLFTKLAREIIVAAKMGGPDPAGNARLRLAIEKAKESSVPKENIDRAVAKGGGGGEGTDYEEIVYEGVGPGGAAFMVEVYSDNRNRTVGELRHAFTKHGGNLAENGAVAWQFKHCGQIVVNRTDVDEETLTLAALDAGADDVLTDDPDVYTVYTPVAGLHACNDALNAAGIPTHDVGLTRVPTNWAKIEAGDVDKVLRLYDAIEELDDVRETYVNVEFPDDMVGDD